MKDFDGNNEQAMLVEVGRATARLIHDFKNQLGGMKLYAAYLKKRFGANPDLAEGLEIADKIAQSVNDMSEIASLVGKLTRPVELKRTDCDFALLVEQAVNQLRPRLVERGQTLETDLTESSPARLDFQQMVLAIGALLSRAIEASPENGRLLLRLRSDEGELQFSVFDQGQSLTAEQRELLFSLMTNERLSKNSLNLVLARRIVEAHGGQIVALVNEPIGTEIRLTIGI